MCFLNSFNSQCIYNNWRYVIEENIKLVRRAFEAFNTGDTSKVSEFISDDYTNRESQGAKDSYRSKLRGPEEFVDTIKNLRIAFPDLHYEESEIISQGNKVIFVGNVNGTHKGNFFFIPFTVQPGLTKSECIGLEPLSFDIDHYGMSPIVIVHR